VAHRFLDLTRDYWQDWIRGLAIPVEWQEAVIRAAIALKLCSFEDNRCRAGRTHYVNSRTR
jgi:hypothetical protein